jgi:hypothetical protein
MHAGFDSARSRYGSGRCRIAACLRDRAIFLRVVVA